MINKTDENPISIPSRRAERHADTVREIHARAWSQMAEHGTSSLSLRELSRSMRMSSAAIYRYYTNRAALISALMIEAFLGINEQMRTAASQIHPDDPAECIKAACRGYRAWALANPEKYALIYGSPISDYQPDWTALLSPAKEGLEIMLDLAREAWKSGRINTSGQPLSSVVEQQMEEILTQRAYGVPPALLYGVITGWTRLHGMVSLEVFGHIKPLIPDMTSVVEYEIGILLGQIGIQQKDQKR